MGMFDTIRCHYPLPEPRLQDAEFQTKDLGQLLQRYEITADGRLVVLAPARSGSDRTAPQTDEAGAEGVEWPFHGDLVMYAHDPDRGRRLVDFWLRFTHGRVEEIRRLEADERRPAGPPVVEWSLTPPLPTSLAAARRPMPGGAAPAPPVPVAAEERDADVQLISLLRERRRRLQELLADCSSHWGFEDPVYRFYHHSFKVYAVQGATRKIVDELQGLAPDRQLDALFARIVEDGTGFEFEPGHNRRWGEVTRPMLEAFFHARYFLEMAVRYGDLEEPPSPLPSGYAALLTLYGLR